MTLVWEVEFPSLAPKMVALKLADCASDQGDSIFPSVDTIERTTGCVQSTVRKWLFAMEHSGLLKVLKRSAGGAHKDTTVRAFDLGLLRRLNPTIDKDDNDVPSELKLIDVRAKRLSQEDKDAPPVVVDIDDPREGSVVTVFRIVPRSPPGQIDQGEGGDPAAPSGSGAPPYGQSDQGGTPPLNGEVDGGTPPPSGGVENATPPPSGGHPSAERGPPLRPADPNRPKPSGIRHSPHSPRKRRGARERVDLLDEVRSAHVHCGRAFEKLLVPLLSRVPLNAPNPEHALATLAELAERQTDEVLDEALKQLATPGLMTYREFDVRPTNIETAIAAGKSIVASRAVVKNGPLIFRNSAEFDAAIAKVAERDPSWAATLRTNEFLRRSALKAYGIQQVAP
jgi:hypothetical protein